MLSAPFFRCIAPCHPKCPAGKAKIEFFDTTLQSFGLEVRGSGTKTFFVRYYEAYRRKRQFKIGDADLLAVTDARTHAREVLRRVELGDDPRVERAEKRQTPTFEAFVRKTFLPFVQRHKRSWKTDESLLRYHILPAIGASRRLGELEPKDSLYIQTHMLEAGKAPGTADRVLILCRYISNCTIRWKTPGIMTNPTADVPLLNVDNTTQRFLSAEETQRLVATLDQPRHRRLKPIVLLLLLTGARRGEVLKARFAEFDLDQRSGASPRASPAGRAPCRSARRPWICSESSRPRRAVRSSARTRRRAARSSRCTTPGSASAATPVCQTCACTTCATPSRPSWSTTAGRSTRCSASWATTPSASRSATRT